MLYHLARKALFQFDPEKAHELTFRQLQRLNHSPFQCLIRQSVATKPVQCMGLSFKNPLVSLLVSIKMVNVSMRLAQWGLGLLK